MQCIFLLLLIPGSGMLSYPDSMFLLIDVSDEESSFVLSLVGGG